MVRKHTEETKAKMSLAHKGRKQSPEWVERRISLIRGREVSQEARQHQSEKMKGRYIGEKNPFYGKKHSIETLEKMKSSFTDERRKQASETMKKTMLNYAVVKTTIPKCPKRIRDSRFCKGCGVSFIPKRNHQLYCSQLCCAIPKRGVPLSDLCKAKMKANHHEVALDKNPRWLGGISFEPYTQDFNARLKDAVRDRDDYLCRLCHKADAGRLLSVHHIDYNKLNTQAINLISLCHHCHSRTNTRREYWSVFLSLMARDYIQCQSLITI